MDMSYALRREQIRTYFDRTAADTWARLTSDAPVSRIRATVRAGRDDMRQTLLGWLPQDLSGKRVLDAGCGTGQLATELARRGADVVAIDLSETLVGIARERMAPDLGPGRIEYLHGDMLRDELGQFDYAVAMDSLIHYRADDAIRALATLCARTRIAVVSTYAPGTLPLVTMRAIGRLFPRGDRAPAIEPIPPRTMEHLIASDAEMAAWSLKSTTRISRGFYKSQGIHLVRR